uniref:E3 ubiquitin-protein ligase SH3RF3 n=1 Tax=Ciona intestinalis TaxID=7719 RepID=UPI000521728F|nr:E3 ubiquitin-protein ligase SH3RF3 [Ciona intestinalis]|eukprot:XP_002123694.2 E3 ubiquitin-protein ligase SH3RF3 [Ciona intestinalis]
MNSEFINDLLECSVCLKPLDQQNKVLPCQHTFCKSCLFSIVRSHKELRCPECRVLVKQKVDDLPANILLIRLLDGIKSQESNKPQQPAEKTEFRRHSVEGILTSSIPASGGAKDGGNGEGGRISTRRNNRHTVHERSGSEPHTTSGLQIPTQSRPHARAIHNYDSQVPSDLSFKKGDLIMLIKKIDENWTSGECHGKMGVFPTNYVEIIHPLPTERPYCFALYDFESSDAEKDRDCLTFSKNEKILVIRRVDENWVEGMLRDKIGIFPLSFVKLSEEARKLFEDLHISDPHPGSKNDGDGKDKGTLGAAARKILSSKPGYKSNKKRHSFPTFQAAKASGEAVPPTTYRHSMELGASASIPTSKHGTTSNTNPTVDSDFQNPTNPSQTSRVDNTVRGGGGEINIASSPTSIKMPMRVSSNVHILQCRTGNGDHGKPTERSPRASIPLPSSGKIVTASYSYHAEKPDELELLKGESYQITEICNDGWCRGVHIKSGKSGVFPGNYVASNIKSQPTQSTKPDNSTPNNPTMTQDQQGSSKHPPPRPKVPPIKIPTSNGGSRAESSSSSEPSSSRGIRSPTSTRQHPMKKVPVQGKKDKSSNLLLKMIGGGKKSRSSSLPTTPAR